ncbi:RNA-guided endonuclease InsQ/TnpB family protein [Actinopolymorpha rutila]|uniref:Transposase n=1 Tax=Actinopolymorpha rutila TaxID=446787 RepID=A0A852ZEJ4_9ACTN|nr:transposase [Actinopolymorpha rutila]
MSIRQRLYPEPGQVVGLVEHCHHARFVYNIGLEQRAMWRRDKHVRGDRSAAKVTTSTQMRELAQLRGELDWLRAGSSSVQQAALRDLDRAFTNFYAGRARYPQFKERNDREGGFVIRDLTVHRLNRKWGVVTVPKVGAVRFRISRLWADVEAASSARVTRRNGRWHIAFTTPTAPKIKASTGAVVGIDRGVKNTLATSEGRMVQAPSLTAAEQARFLALQQHLTRQRNGSRRRRRTLDRLAVLRRRLEDRRTDWVEQTTTDLAHTYDLLAVEDLRVPNMVRRPVPKPDPAQPGVFVPNGARAKATLNRAILASVWGRFLTRLEHKMPEGAVVRVDPKNTSCTCAACGHCAPGNRESQAAFECEACGHQAHADTNAAVNILARGLSTIPEESGYTAGHEARQQPSGRKAAVNGRISPTATSAAGNANQPAA